MDSNVDITLRFLYTASKKSALEKIKSLDKDLEWWKEFCEKIDPNNIADYYILRAILMQLIPHAQKIPGYNDLVWNFSNIAEKIDFKGDGFADRLMKFKN